MSSALNSIGHYVQHICSLPEERTNMCERAVRILCYIREIWRARHLQPNKNVVRHRAKLSDDNFVCGASDDPRGCVEIAKVALAAGTKKKMNSTCNVCKVRGAA